MKYNNKRMLEISTVNNNLSSVFIYFSPYTFRLEVRFDFRSPCGIGAAAATVAFEPLLGKAARVFLTGMRRRRGGEASTAGDSTAGAVAAAASFRRWLRRARQKKDTSWYLQT